MLGKAAADIGSAIRQSLSEHLIQIAQPYIDDLRNSLGTTTGLEVWMGNNTILGYRARNPHHIHAAPRPGMDIPVNISAGARAILAFSQPELVDTVLQRKFKRFTPNTITDPDMFKKKLSEVRKEGVAFTHGERHIDVDVIAAPVFNHEKRPVAAAIISTPTNEVETLTKSNAIALLKETAAKISARLLYAED